MKKNLFIPSMVVLGLIIILIVISQDYLWSSDSKLSKNRGYLGVSVKKLTTSLKKELDVKEGVVVTSVVEDSPADKAGIMEEDVIVEVAGNEIKTPETLTRVIRKIKPGTEVDVVVIRDGKKESIKVKISKLKGCCQYFYGDFSPLHFKFRSHPYLGVTLQELNDNLADYFGVKADEGVLILEVREDSPAEKAGLKAGDVIAKIEDENVSLPEDVKDIISDYEEGDKLSIEVIRHKSKQTVTVVLEENGHREREIFIKKLPDIKRMEEDVQKNLKLHKYRLKDELEQIKIKFDDRSDFI